MKSLILAVRWEVKVEGNSRSIQLYDKDNNKIDGDKARWDGNFNCHNNKLTTLRGAPKEVGGHFDCYNNKLTSLSGAPKEVGGNFSCSYNQLTNLTGAPEGV